MASNNDNTLSTINSSGRRCSDRKEVRLVCNGSPLSIRLSATLFGKESLIGGGGGPDGGEKVKFVVGGSGGGSGGRAYVGEAPRVIFAGQRRFAVWYGFVQNLLTFWAYVRMQKAVSIAKGDLRG